MSDTHLSSFTAKRRVAFDAPPVSPVAGEFYYDNLNNRLAIFTGTQWVFADYTTTTSTSTSTTSTSTSTTSTSTSTSTSSSTSTSTTTSTTTTL